MNDLLKKYNDYMRLENCTAKYKLENGQVIDFTYKESNFIHLLGLHKLKDLQLIMMFNDKNNRKVKTQYIISRIKKEKFTDTMIKKSNFYSVIEDRYNNFSYETLTTMSYTDAIIDFDSQIICSKIKSDYLLFEKKGKNYNHLGIALDTNNNQRYIETFFCEPSTNYISSQNIVKVKEFELYAPDNQIIVKDSF